MTISEVRSIIYAIRETRKLYINVMTAQVRFPENERADLFAKKDSGRAMATIKRTKAVPRIALFFGSKHQQDFTRPNLSADSSQFFPNASTTRSMSDAITRAKQGCDTFTSRLKNLPPPVDITSQAVRYRKVIPYCRNLWIIDCRCMLTKF